MTGISADYFEGVGAPDPKTVIGGDLETKNGAAFSSYVTRAWASGSHTTELPVQ